MEKIDQILESLYDRVIEPVEAKEQLLLLFNVMESTIQLFSGSLQDIQEIIEFLQWVYRKIDKGDTPEETVRMLLMNRAKIDNIKFESNDR